MFKNRLEIFPFKETRITFVLTKLGKYHVVGLYACGALKIRQLLLESLQATSVLVSAKFKLLLSQLSCLKDKSKIYSREENCAEEIYGRE